MIRCKDYFDSTDYFCSYCFPRQVGLDQCSINRFKKQIEKIGISQTIKNLLIWDFSDFELRFFTASIETYFPQHLSKINNLNKYKILL